jgi:hypothetical protein
MTHLTFEEINELADGRTRSGGYPPTGDGQEPTHLESCAECRDTLRRVRSLIAAAHALPRDVAPPPEVWDALQLRVAVRSGRSRTKWWVGGWVAAAAAIVLLVGSAVLMPPAANKLKGSKPSASAQPVASPVMLAAVEQNYVRTVAELRATLDQQRATLSPATIRILERSLATIDTAIAEARAALASDPANQTLVDILSANYEHKLELLQRATQLSPST